MRSFHIISSYQEYQRFFYVSGFRYSESVREIYFETLQILNLFQSTQTFANVERRFWARREELFSRCKLHEDAQLAKVGSCSNFDYWPSKEARSHLMMHKNSKIMGCLVEKSGSSSWHKIFWTLRKRMNNQKRSAVIFKIYPIIYIKILVK